MRVAGRLVGLFWCRTLSPQAAEDLPCVGFNEGIWVSLVCCDFDRRWVKVVEVDRPDDSLEEDAGCKGGRYPIPLAVLGIPGAVPAEVSGVRQIAPRLVLKSVPLAQEVVPAMVANLRIFGGASPTPR